MTSSALTISDISIRQDEHGRYCLNDLHKAAGGEKRHSPNYWLSIQQTQELIEELKNSVTVITVTEQNQLVIEPFVTLQGGTVQGTFTVKELVYAYATWISAKFFLKVIRAYDSLVNQKESPYITEREASVLSKAVLAVDKGKQARVLYRKLYDAYGITSYHHLPAGKLNEALTFLGLREPELDELVLVEKRKLTLEPPADMMLVDKKKYEVLLQGFHTNFIESANMSFIPPVGAVAVDINDYNTLIIKAQRYDKIKGVFEA